jgi:hypothetical protein
MAAETKVDKKYQTAINLSRRWRLGTSIQEVAERESSIKILQAIIDVLDEKIAHSKFGKMINYMIEYHSSTNIYRVKKCGLYTSCALDDIVFYCMSLPDEDFEFADKLWNDCMGKK